MKYLEMKIETAPEMIETILNELAVAGITDAVIDNPLEIAEMVAALGDTEWYDAEQVANDFLPLAPSVGNGKHAKAGKDSKSTGNTKNVVSATVTVYCTDDEEGRARANAVRKITDAINDAVPNSHNEMTGSSITITETWRDDSEWKDAWKEYYHTSRVSERFIVKPTWEVLPDNIYDVGIAPGLVGFMADMEDANAQERNIGNTNAQELFVIEIDPGMAFGTGTHETTSLSLRMMEKYVKPGDKVLDVGTGSGILAIAAAKLGAQDVLGIDIDEDAVRVANENINSNIHARGIGAGERTECADDKCDADCGYAKDAAYGYANVRAVVGDLTEGIEYKADIVVANLLADLVIKLTSSVAKHMADDAVYITSGILVDKELQVTSCLVENGLRILEILQDGEWCSIAAKRDKC